jgi:hypothetical protein
MAAGKTRRSYKKYGGPDARRRERVGEEGPGDGPEERPSDSITGPHTTLRTGALSWPLQNDWGRQTRIFCGRSDPAVQGRGVGPKIILNFVSWLNRSEATNGI